MSWPRQIPQLISKIQIWIFTIIFDHSEQFLQALLLVLMSISSDSWMARNSNYEILFYKILVTFKSSSVIMESWWWLLDCDSPKHWSWHYTVVILKINNPQFGKIFFSKSFDVYYLMDLSRLITERAHNSIEINILSWTIFFSTIEKHQVKATKNRRYFWILKRKSSKMSCSRWTALQLQIIFIEIDA